MAILLRLYYHGYATLAILPWLCYSGEGRRRAARRAQGRPGGLPLRLLAGAARASQGVDGQRSRAKVRPRLGQGAIECPCSHEGGGGRWGRGRGRGLGSGLGLGLGLGLGFGLGDHTMHAASSHERQSRPACPFVADAAPPLQIGHPGTAATVGAVWLFFINPTAALFLFMGYRFLMNQ